MGLGGGGWMGGEEGGRGEKVERAGGQQGGRTAQVLPSRKSVCKSARVCVYVREFVQESV